MRATICRGAKSRPFSTILLLPLGTQESGVSTSKHSLQPYKQSLFTRSQRPDFIPALSSYSVCQGNSHCFADFHSTRGSIAQRNFESQAPQRGSLSGNSFRASEKESVTRVGSNMGTTTAPIKMRYEEDADMREVLFSADVLAAKVAELGKQISEDFAGKPVVLLGLNCVHVALSKSCQPDRATGRIAPTLTVVLDLFRKYGVASQVATGAFLFLADLARAISLPVQIDFVKAASYGVGTTSSGAVAITKDTVLDLVGQNVIVVEDIIDTGHTLNKLVKHLSQKAPATVSVCALLNKEARRVVSIEYPPGGKEYIGFPSPDEFVVGYGLDFAERYRSLPYIGILKPEIFS